MIIKQPRLLLLMTGYISSLGIITTIKDLKRIQKNTVINNNNKNITKQNESKKITNYYTQKYHKYINEAKKLNNDNNPEIKIKIYETSLLENQELLEQIKKEIDIYYEMYELPPFIVKDEELYIIIDILRKYNNVNSNKTLIYYNSLINIIRKTFSKSLINDYNSIGTEDILENFYYFKDYGLKDKDIKMIIEEIVSEIQKICSYSLNNYAKKNLKKK